MGECLLVCIIPGEPIGKGRPRVTTIGGKGRAYTPKRTRNWEMGAAELLASAYDGEPLDEPLRLDVFAFFPRPKRLDCSHKRKPCSCPDGWDMSQRHTARPDADNLAKAVCDALERAGVVRNDSVFWSVAVRKWYHRKGGRPIVRVEVTR